MIALSPASVSDSGPKREAFEEGLPWASVFEHHPEATLVVDPLEDRVLAANRAACELLRYPRGELLALRPSALHPAELPALVVFTQAVLDAGHGWTHELCCRDGNGEEVPVEYLARVVASGGKTLLVVTLRDRREVERRRLDAEADAYVRRGIAEWRKVERLFQEIEQENQLILQAAGEGIYGVNAEGVTTFVNPAAERLLGWSAAEMVGRNMHELVHHSHPDGSPYRSEGCPIYAAFRDGAVHHVDDEVFWHQLNPEHLDRVKMGFHVGQKITPGSRLKPVWAENRTGTIEDIMYFELDE